MTHILRIIQVVFLLCMPSVAFMQNTVYEDHQGIWHAQVIEILDTKTELLPPDNIETVTQTLRAELLEGAQRGEIVTFDNDYIQLEEGQKFFINYFKPLDGNTYYSVHEIDRRIPIISIFLLFTLVLVAFSGMQGLRSILALAGSIFVVLYILVPTLVAGFPPVATSIAVAITILFFAIYFTHGFNKLSSVAFLGTSLSVILSGFLAMISIHITRLTGFADDASVYLNFNTGGTLDFVGLLLAGIIIGAIGVLDDIAITQVAVVRELYETDTKLTHWDIYHKALRIGREHIGALVNTLVLAYTGTALPLLLLFSQSASGFGSMINREVFATEIVRALIGSIGLILAVPITTWLAIYIFKKYPPKKSARAHAHAHIH